MILQDGNGIGVMFLYPEGFWVFGFSTLSPTNRIEGTLTQTDGTHYGSYSLTLNNGADTLTITCNVRFDGDTPSISSGDELLELSLPFVCLSATSDAAAITAVLVNSDTTAT